jgi:hypothetical protein
MTVSASELPAAPSCEMPHTRETNNRGQLPAQSISNAAPRHSLNCDDLGAALVSYLLSYADMP